MRFSDLAITVVSISSVSAFSGVGTSPTKLQYTFLKMSSEKKHDELVETGNKLSHPGYVHSARDHSTGSVDARVQSVGAEDIEEKRAEWRELLFSTKGFGRYVFGATLYQSAPSGNTLIEILDKQDVISREKDDGFLDTKLKPLAGGRKVKSCCNGLIGFCNRCAHQHARARFAKWRYN